MLKSATVMYVQPCAVPREGCHVVEVCVETDAPSESISFVGNVLRQQVWIDSWNYDGRTRLRCFVVVSGCELAYQDDSTDFPVFLKWDSQSAREIPQPVAEIGIALATHEPDEELLKRQIDSIISQTATNWHCIVSDDRSSNRHAIADLIAGDSRFTMLPEQASRVGFYRNFERALTAASEVASYVALCDQDDSWKPTKLEALKNGIGDCDLACSHVEVVDRDGFPTSPRKVLVPRSSTDIRDEIVANSVPGMSMLLSRGLIQRCLPFPDLNGVYHDHWLTLSALAGKGIAVVPQILVDYTQHDGNVIGAVKPWAVDRGKLKFAVLQHFRAERMSGTSLKSDRPTDFALAALAVHRATRSSSLSQALVDFDAIALAGWTRKLQLKNLRQPLAAGEAHLFSWKLQQAASQRAIEKFRPAT
jgi:Glycosyl transferase family 2